MIGTSEIYKDPFRFLYRSGAFHAERHKPELRL